MSNFIFVSFSPPPSLFSFLSLSGLILLVSLPSQCLFFLFSPAPVICLFVCSLPSAPPAPCSLLVISISGFLLFSFYLFVCVNCLCVCLFLSPVCQFVCFPLQGYFKEQIKAHLVEGPKYHYELGTNQSQ